MQQRHLASNNRSRNNRNGVMFSDDNYLEMAPGYGDLATLPLIPFDPR
jgi:hypothetical protein